MKMRSKETKRCKDKWRDKGRSFFFPSFFLRHLALHRRKRGVTLLVLKTPSSLSLSLQEFKLNVQPFLGHCLISCNVINSQFITASRAVLPQRAPHLMLLQSLAFCLFPNSQWKSAIIITLPGYV